VAGPQLSSTVRRRYVKRLLVIILIFILFGSLANVTVAWLCAVAIDVRLDGIETIKGVIMTSEGHWEVTRIDRFGTTWVASTQSKRPFEYHYVTEPPPEAVIPSWGNLAGHTEALRSPNVEQEMRFVDARGWPMRTLWCEVGGWLSGPQIGVVAQQVRGGIDTSLPTSMRLSVPITRVLPLRPVWPGLIVNTLVYAVLIATPFLLRRYLRVKRALCPKCGYPSGTSPTCTECGTPLAASSGVA